MSRYGRNPGAHPVESHAATWHDADRGRDVPARLYLPADALEPAPLVVFSHGTGSSCDEYTYAGRHWASHGYVVIHPTHVGTDRSAMFDANGRVIRPMEEILADARHWTERPRDIVFVLDRLASDDEWKGRVDLRRVGVAGHSYGAHTALALVGLRLNLPDAAQVSCADARVKAAIAMSPASEGKLGLFADSWSRIDRPVLALTGTKDIEYKVGSAARRRTSFDRTPGPDQHLLTIQGATHATFTDPPRLRIGTQAHNPVHTGYVLMATTAFLDAYLKDESRAREWLAGDELHQLSGGAGVLERKAVTRSSRA